MKAYGMNHISALRVAVMALIVMLSLPLVAQRRSSLHRRLKVAKDGSDAEVVIDSVPASKGVVRFSGYEKTLRSTRETVFVTNLSSREMEGVIFTITYKDASGRQLHQARRVAHVGIPVGETRRVDFPSWDKQFTFYYVGSPRPRVSSIPYDVEIRPDTLFLFSTN